MREFLIELREAFKRMFGFIFNFKERIKELEIDNIRIVHEFLETGELLEAKNRLKIISSLWSNNLEIKYLSGFLFLLANKKDDSLASFEKPAKHDYKMSKEFINFLKDDRLKELQDIYYKNFSLIMVEIYLENSKKS